MSVAGHYCSQGFVWRWQPAVSDWMKQTHCHNKPVLWLHRVVWFQKPTVCLYLFLQVINSQGSYAFLLSCTVASFIGFGLFLLFLYAQHIHRNTGKHTSGRLIWRCHVTLILDRMSHSNRTWHYIQCDLISLGNKLVHANRVDTKASRG